MYNCSSDHAETRARANLEMLKASLRKVYPARNDNQFSDLLRRLDSASRA